MSVVRGVPEKAGVRPVLFGAWPERLGSDPCGSGRVSKWQSR
jgi:hypothetical protein